MKSTKLFQHKKGITENVRIGLAAELQSLCDALIDAKCTDMVILTRTDRLCRRLFSDIDGGWMRWSYYCKAEVFHGDSKAYESWAMANCLPTKP